MQVTITWSDRGEAAAYTDSLRCKVNRANWRPHGHENITLFCESSRIGCPLDRLTDKHITKFSLSLIERRSDTFTVVGLSRRRLARDYLGNIPKATIGKLDDAIVVFRYRSPLRLYSPSSATLSFSTISPFLGCVPLAAYSAPRSAAKATAACWESPFSPATASSMPQSHPVLAAAHSPQSDAAARPGRNRRFPP